MILYTETDVNIKCEWDDYLQQVQKHKQLCRTCFFFGLCLLRQQLHQFWLMWKKRLSVLFQDKSCSWPTLAAVSQQGQWDLKTKHQGNSVLSACSLTNAPNKQACYIEQVLLLRQGANRLLLLSLFMWQSSFLHLPLSRRWSFMNETRSSTCFPMLSASPWVVREFEELPLVGVVMKAVCPTEDDELIICVSNVEAVPRIYQRSVGPRLAVLQRDKSRIFIALCVHVAWAPAESHGFVINPCHNVVRSHCLHHFLNYFNRLLQIHASSWHP